MVRDANDVTALTNHIKCSMTNPFDVTSHPGTLINISTGLHTSTKAQSTLPNAFHLGQHMMEQCLDKCLSEGQEKSFYAAISKSGVVSFADMHGASSVMHSAISA